MAVSDEDVRKLARLARLELTDGEVARAASDLGQLLEYIAQIQAVDCSGASEPAHPLGALRDDVARPGLPRDLLTRDAPSAAHGLFEVPRVVTRKRDESAT